MSKSVPLAALFGLALLAVTAGCGGAALVGTPPADFPPPGQPGFAFVFSDP